MSWQHNAKQSGAPNVIHNTGAPLQHLSSPPPPQQHQQQQSPHNQQSAHQQTQNLSGQWGGTYNYSNPQDGQSVQPPRPPSGSNNWYTQQQQHQQQQSPPSLYPLPPTSASSNWQQPPNFTQSKNSSYQLNNNPNAPPPQSMMASANSNVFDNNSSNDGWGDWDWNDNNQQNLNRAKAATPRNQMQQQQYPSVPLPPQPPHHQSTTTDQMNNQLNPMASLPPTQYGQTFPNYQPQQQLSEQHKIPPQQAYQQQPTTTLAFQSNISTNFPTTTTSDTNWNWQSNEHHSTSDNVDILFPKVSKEASQKLTPQPTPTTTTTVPDQSFNKPELLSSNNFESRQPDDVKNTQLNNPTLTRLMRAEPKLTPQWSIESQMSQTSSDRSMESGDALDSRSTNTSEEQHLPDHRADIPNIMSNYEIETDGYNPKSADNLDSLDEALMALNVNKDIGSSYYQTDPVPPPLSAPTNWQNVQKNEPIGDQSIVGIQSKNISQFSSDYGGQHYPNQYHAVPPNTVSFGQTTQQQFPSPFARPTSSSDQPQSHQTSDTVTQHFNPTPPPPLQSAMLPPSNQMPPLQLSSFPSPIQSSALPPPIQSSALPPPIQSSALPPPIQSSALPPPIQPGAMPPPIQPGAVSPIQLVAMPPPTQSATLPPPQSAFTPPSSVLPVPPATTTESTTNPFKRSGIPVHKTLPFQSSAATSTQPSPSPPFQSYKRPIANSPHDLNQELLPDNAEIPDEIAVPHNDRNQYLQTGHLSEESYHQESSQQFQSSMESDNLPPPGLSRLVLGQPEIESAPQNRSNEPPPGLDRMIPGTEVVTHLNLERQADGQDTSDTSSTRLYTIAAVGHPPPPPSSSSSDHHNLDYSDRNLYRVPGEISDNNVQRVVTGLDYGRNQEIPIVEQQRELIMDGENLDDQQQLIEEREEPIEGANTLDDIQTAIPANMSNGDNESNATVDNSKKFNSNPSTCNDDSDKERQMYYRSDRRRDDRRKQREKHHQRFDSEDTDYYSDRERRRFSRDTREGSIRRGDKENSHEREHDGAARPSRENNKKDDRGKEKFRDDREYRRRYDDRYDRYERDKYGERDRYSSRYETDASRYETDDRYSKRGGRRDDGGGDKRYRRDERDDRAEHHHDRDVDGRKLDDRYRDGAKSYDRRRDKQHRPTTRGDRYYEYDDDYRRTSSRNAIERERTDREKRYGSGGSGPLGVAAAATAAAATANYYPQNYGYDQYSYYQHQQYYETLRRTNPQAYAEWYKRYYSQQMQQQIPMPSATDIIGTDGRESVHSGRSSANEKDRNDHLDSLNTGESNQPQRYTPCKFTVDHCVASLSNGLMVCVKPQFSSNDVTNVVKVLNIGFNDATRKLFNIFPGPLVRGITHKKTVIDFCEEQIRLGPWNLIRSRGNSMSSLASLGHANRSSYTLMWNLLILLLRQNGMVVGTDISELLLQNKLEFPYETYSMKKLAKVQQPQSRRNSIDSLLNPKEMCSATPSLEGSGIHEDLDADTDHCTKKILTEEEITDKFRNYLLYGNVNEALEWATDNNLWGHALFLASKVDRRSHANVLMKFANKLQLNDPLQTLYQLMSGRTPSSVTSIQDEKWGDWRPHLAMILANTSQKPELDRKSITTLGDSLYNRGDLFAAQFCYLMAQVGFGKYTNVNQESMLISNSTMAIRLVLLGASQHKPFREFATNEAIIMTEIYEYACTLNDEKFSIVDFQSFKYLLATRMIDYGMQLKALMYLEQIANHIQRNPSKYERGFIEKIYKLADQLKYFDPVLDRLADDPNMDEGDTITNTIEDQPWLQELGVLVQQQANIGETNAPVYLPPKADYQYDTKNQIDQQFDQINKQFSELNLQYNTYDSTNYNQAYGGPQSLGVDQSYQGSYYDPNVQQQQQHQQQQPNSIDGGNMDSMNYNNYYDPNVQQTNTDQIGGNDQPNYDYWNQQQSSNEIPKPTISMPNSVSNKPGFYDDTPPSPTASTHHNQQSNQTDQLSDQSRKDQTTARSKNSSNQSSNSNSGWFGGIWNKLSLKPKNQMILPDDKNPTIVWDPDKKRWVNTDGEEQESEQFKPPPKMSELPKTMHGGGGGGAQTMHDGGGIAQFNMQPSMAEPMSLPPTLTNQSIGHDMSLSASGNARRHSAEQSPMTPLVNSSSSNINKNTEPTPIAPKTPNLQSNMFKMQRNRTLKNSYVDVFNPSGAPSKPIEPVMAPAMPTTVPQSGFFVPDPSAMSAYGQQSSDTNSQYYNPNHFTANSDGGYQQPQQQ